MKRIHALALAIAWALAPTVGFGADLLGGLGGEVEYDSNARRTTVDPQQDVIFRISPWVEMVEDEGKLNYGFNYRFPYEWALKVQRIDGFRHFVNAHADYNFSDRTVLAFSDVFSRSDSVNSVTAEDDVATINTFTDPVNRNVMRLGLTHSFTPRLQTSGNFTYQLFTTNLPGRADNQTFGLSLNNVYQLTPRHRVGGGVAVNYQDFDASNNGDRTPSQTLFANVFGSWAWFIDETTTLEIAAGPTFIDTHQDAAPQTSFQDRIPFYQQSSSGPIVVSDLGSCVDDTIDGTAVQILVPGTVACPRFAVIDDQNYLLWDGSSGGWGADQAAVASDIQAIRDNRDSTELIYGPDQPASLSSTSWTIFAQAALTKRWTPNLISTASYTRRDSTASGIAGSAVLDFVSLQTDWRISELWDAGLRADWTRRQSTGPVDQLVLVVDDGATNGVIVSSAPLSPGGLFPEGLAYNASYSTRRVTQSIDTNRWGFQARIRRRITRNLSTGLRYTFNRQSSASGTAGSRSDFNDHIVTLNVQYDFDRWNLW